ncbi:MAG: hypothetical protein IT381_18890 [Deltaproteobacteria bacterium]|nr:hypothetical protein [Deltaproteobacteria bacterium]
MRRFVPLLLALVACNTAFRTAVDLAEQALLRNDLPEAARQYLVACRIDPDATKICEKATSLTTEVVQHAVEEASLALGRGDVDYALDLVAPARRISTDARLFQIAENAGDVMAERCAAGAELIAKAAEVRCLESRHRKVAVQKYTALVGDRRDEAAALMLDRAVASDGKLVTLAAALRVVAQCTAKSRVRAEERTAAERRMLDAVAIPFSLKVSARGLGDATDVLQSACKAINTRTAARCASQAQSDAQALALDASVSALGHTVQDDHRSVRYVAGVDRVPNPRYKELKHKLRRAEDELYRRRPERDRARSRCQSANNAPSNPSCSEASGLDATVRSLESERDRAESDLRSTPELVDQPRWEDYNYVAQVHTWWVDFTLRLARGGAEPLAVSGRLDYSGEDRRGFSPANVSASVARAPTERTFANDLYPRERDLVMRAVKDAMLEAAAATQASCGEETEATFWPWLDCQLRAALYRDGNPVPPFWRAIEPKMATIAREAPEYPCEP